MTDDYAPLRRVLDAAYDQAAHGKGCERHGNGRPWAQQPIFQIANRHGSGFLTGQVAKKADETAGMIDRCDFDAAIRELLGVIVYAAAAVAWCERQRGGR